VSEEPADAWLVVGAAAAGSAHVAAGLSSQDRFYHDLRRDAAGRAALVIAVADGASFAKYGALGATRALEGFAFAVRETLTNHAIEAITLTDCQGWLRAARRAILATAEAEGAAATDYACTFTAAVNVGEHVFALQIGDGIIAFRVAANEDWQLAFRPQKGDHPNETRFLTDDDTDASAMTELLMHDVAALAVCTDGVENLGLDRTSGTAFSPFFASLTATVLATPSREVDELPEALRRYLDSGAVNARTDDDKTMVLAVRRPAPAEE
jgi:hypothetical protein